jgi:hypothetical protein
MEKENTNLFPEKDLIDLTFMDHIRFNCFVPVNRAEIDKAIQEYNCLKVNAAKCTNVFLQKQRDLDKKYEAVSNHINGFMDNILKGVEECIANNWTDYGISYGDDDKCVIDFEHGKVLLEQTTKTKFKIKPVKEN